MLAARKFETFCVEPKERWAFGGTFSGQIVAVEIETFAVMGEVQAHAGTIIAMAAHARLPYIACLSMDRTVSVWRYNEKGHLFPVMTCSIRDVRPSNDDGVVGFVQSNSQTIAFHGTLPRIVTRSGNAGLLELDFDDDGTVSVVRCVRLHGDMDIVTARYAGESSRVLSGDGEGVVILSEEGEELKRWQVADRSIHWFEHLGGATYLLASDACLVARLDLYNGEAPAIGSPFTRDDLEQVTYNPVSGRAFAASFDRNIYEVDPRTLEPLGVVYKAPFKCRWLKSLQRDPSILLVQVRDGGLHKVDLESGKALAVIKDTPEALWTAVSTPAGDILLSGEGEAVTRLQINGTANTARKPVFSALRVPVGALQPGAYTKRMVYQTSTGRLVLGRTDGDIVVGEDGAFRRLTNLGSAVRDLAVAPEGDALFVACEDGHGYRVDLGRGERLLDFSAPHGKALWSLAHNPTRNLVAFLERNGTLSVLDADDFTPIIADVVTSRAKRAKWLDADRLLYSHSEELHELNVVSGATRARVTHAGNTIEDFIWDGGQNYLVLICYTCMLLLYDFSTDQLLSVVPDQIDYSKGLIWVDTKADPRLYPLDFLTFGRSGTAHHFRIHDEKILALGPVNAGPILKAMPAPELVSVRS
ncbi:MAG TPA: WD40 repeat domain-containing protein [Dehalococcoidia bacterium]|nr:WD40 repeat domain-containing protein [Dehalococcoidia bacterium]